MKYHTVIFALLVGASYQITLKNLGPEAVELDEEEMDRVNTAASLKETEKEIET
tara:strand:+ start:74 stop:235 length:162 start_codon:yes stop_codon:yes gene_type:complete